MQTVETRKCGGAHSPNCGSPFPKDEVPIALFKKNPSDVKLLKNCQHCRDHQSAISKAYFERIDKLHEDSKLSNNGNPTHLYCTSTAHGNTNASNHPRDHVPIDMFRKVPGNVRSILLKRCSDCRSVTASESKTRIQEKKSTAAVNGNFFCTNCHHEKPLTDQAPNLDGTPSILCYDCKDGERARSLNIRSVYRDIKLEMALKQQSCCYECKSMFLRVYPDALYPVEVPTFAINGERYYDLLDKRYKVSDTIKYAREVIEVDILELDHLPEAEQRARGLLLPNEIYVPKNDQVSKLSSEPSMRLESHKCQLLCSRCHIKETIDREIAEEPLYGKSNIEKEKLLFTWSLKAAGCELCKYVNPELPRFFHFDHLDPRIKEECIARMTKDSKYTVDDVRVECLKCRVLCGHCHKLHTLRQKKDGTI